MLCVHLAGQSRGDTTPDGLVVAPVIERDTIKAARKEDLPPIPRSDADADHSHTTVGSQRPLSSDPHGT